MPSHSQPQGYTHGGMFEDSGMACSAFSLVQVLHSSRKSCLCLPLQHSWTISWMQDPAECCDQGWVFTDLSQPPVSSVSFSQQTQDAFVEELLTFIFIPRGKTCSQPFFSTNVIEINGASGGKWSLRLCRLGKWWYPHCHHTSPSRSVFSTHREQDPAASQPSVLSICADCNFYPS